MIALNKASRGGGIIYIGIQILKRERKVIHVWTVQKMKSH